jgi:ketol-acid reductoisomerase
LQAQKGTKETIYERSDWLLAKLQDYFKNDTLCTVLKTMAEV